MDIPANFDILFLIGLALVGGLFGAKIFKKLGIPQIIGYIAIGILIGKSGFQFINDDTFQSFEKFNIFALGIIGFLVGSEIEYKVVKKYAKQFISILLFEGLTSFFFVGVLIFSLLYYITGGDVTISLVAGLIFGSISSATDPASTMNVIWEYRARGPLSKTISTIIALDDILALALYGVCLGIARTLTSTDSSFLVQLRGTFIELTLSVVIGVLFGLLMKFFLKKSSTNKNDVSIIMGMLLLLIGIIQILEFDVILSSMAAGLILRNVYSSKRSLFAIESLKNYATPIYVIFFVLVGANLKFASVTWWMWIMIGLYIIGRSFGKFLGAYIGGTVSKSDSIIRKYTGIGLSAQGGAAIGLSIMSGYFLKDIMVMGQSLGAIIVASVTASTFIIQLIGPSLVKLALKKADELNKDLNEEDILKLIPIDSLITEDIVCFNNNTSLNIVFKKMSEVDQTIFPVIDERKNLVGYLDLEILKNLIFEQEMWQWVVANDVVNELDDFAYKNDDVNSIIEKMKRHNLNTIVILNPEDKLICGEIRLKKALSIINSEIIKRRKDM